MKIIRNMARCRLCGDVIESKTVHEHPRCSCGAITVDGGHEYLARTGNWDNIEDLSEVEFIDLSGHGIDFVIEKNLHYLIEELLEAIADECWGFAYHMVGEVGAELKTSFEVGCLSAEQRDRLHEKFIAEPTALLDQKEAKCEEDDP